MVVFWSSDLARRCLLGSRIMLNRLKSSLLIKALCYHSCSFLLNTDYAVILFLLHRVAISGLKSRLLAAVIDITKILYFLELTVSTFGTFAL